MKMRQPNRRRFKSTIRERQKRQREYFYASVSVLVVKIILLVFLIILCAVSFRLFHYRFAHLTPPIRYAVPTMVAIFAIILIYFIYKNFKDMRGIQREKRKT
jgi:amino acid permease